MSGVPSGPIPADLCGYGRHVAQALVEGRRIPSQRTLAPMLGVSHKTLSAALLRDGAQAWLTEELRRHLEAEPDVTERVLARVAGMALHGNLEAARIYFKAVGRVGGGRRSSRAIATRSRTTSRC